MNLLEARDRSLRLMHEAGRNAKKLGRDWAAAEAEYEKAKWLTILKLKDEGFPATLIGAGIKGHPDVNEKFEARLSADVDYRSELNAEQDFKKEACLIEDQIKREWTAAKEIL